MIKYFFLKGYTLVELAVVLVIIIIMYSSVSVSSMYLFPQHAKNDARQIMSDLIWARSRALNSQLSSCFAFTDPAVSNHTYSIYNSTCGAGGALINDISMPSFICSPDVNGAACNAIAASGAFNISVYNNSDAVGSNVAGSFGLPANRAQMRINVKFINSTESIRLFNATGFVRMD